MNNSRTKRIRKIILGQSLVALLITVVAGYLVIYALGYRINLSARKIIKTGMIVLSVNPEPDSVQVGRLELEPKEDVSVSLEPGFYDITIKKSGYQDWTIRSEVKAELVSFYKYIELFRLPTELQELTDSDSIAALNTPTTTLAVNVPKGLTCNDYEIWLKESLVTRFSESISSVNWLYDNRHIIFQQGDEIRVIDTDGTNNKVLAKLKDASRAKFISSKRDQAIFIEQNNKYYSCKIQ